MARKVLNRKALREEAEAAAAAEKAGGAAEKVESPAKKKPPAKRKSRAATVTQVRVKLYWGVFTQSMKRVAVFEFDQKKQADKKAEELNKAGKTPHFVQKVKEVIE